MLVCIWRRVLPPLLGGGPAQRPLSLFHHLLSYFYHHLPALLDEKCSNTTFSAVWLLLALSVWARPTNVIFVVVFFMTMPLGNTFFNAYGKCVMASVLHRVIHPWSGSVTTPPVSPWGWSPRLLRHVLTCVHLHNCLHRVHTYVRMYVHTCGCSRPVEIITKLYVVGRRKGWMMKERVCSKGMGREEERKGCNYREPLLLGLSSLHQPLSSSNRMFPVRANERTLAVFTHVSLSLPAPRSKNCISMHSKGSLASQSLPRVWRGWLARLL